MFDKADLRAKETIRVKEYTHTNAGKIRNLNQVNINFQY